MMKHFARVLIAVAVAPVKHLGQNGVFLPEQVDHHSQPDFADPKIASIFGLVPMRVERKPVIPRCAALAACKRFEKVHIRSGDVYSRSEGVHILGGPPPAAFLSPKLPGYLFAMPRSVAPETGRDCGAFVPGSFVLHERS